MTSPSPHLPPGFDKLTGAETGSGWTLCWDRARAAAYSRDTGWIDLGGLKGIVSLALPTPSGIVLLSGDAGMAGFWRYGDRSWSWWEEVTLLREVSYVRCAGHNLVLFFFAYPANRFQFFSIASELTAVGEVQSNDYGQLIGASLDQSGRLILTCGEGIFLLRPETNPPSLEPIVSRPIHTELLHQAVAIPSPDSVYLARPLEANIRVDTATGEVSDTGLGHISGCGSLWRALAAGRRDEIPFLLEALKFIPKAESRLTDEVLAVSFDRHHTSTVATPAGIIEVTVASTCSACHHANPVTDRFCSSCQHPVTHQLHPEPLTENAATHHQAEVLSWNLLLEPARFSPEALDQLLESIGSSARLLATSVAKAIGMAACEGLIERARKLEVDHMHSRALEGAQLLFGHFGPQIADLVQRCLTDSNPGVVALGCAAAVARWESASHIWDWDLNHPIPASELIELLGHDHHLIRTLAAEACGALRIEESQQRLVELFSDDAWPVRRSAVESVAALPSLDPTTQTALAHLATHAVDDSVREAAIEAVGKHAAGAESVDTLIRALSDLVLGPRSSAAEAVTEHAADLSSSQFLRIVDIATLVMMTANLADDPTDFTLGMDDLILNILRRLGERAEDVEGLARMAPELQQIFYRCTVLTLFPVTRADEASVDGDDEVEEVRTVLERLGPGELLNDGDYERLLESPGDPPSFDLAARVSRTDAELGSRLAVIATFTHRDDPYQDHRAASAEYGLEGYQPLHLRLRAETVAPTAPELCRDLVEKQAQQRGAAGFAALYALAAAGDDSAVKRLTGRILTGELDGCDVVLSSLLTVVNRPHRPELMERIIAARGIPLRTRLVLYNEWSVSHDLELSVSERRPLLLEASTAPDVPDEDRLGAARELADIGETEVLERYWARTDPGDLDPDRLYEFSKDMARAGHQEHLQAVRGTWIDRGDLEALKAFAAVGTEEDLAEMERALELKAPEKRIRDTMAIIRARTSHG